MHKAKVGKNNIRTITTIPKCYLVTFCEMTCGYEFNTLSFSLYCPLNLDLQRQEQTLCLSSPTELILSSSFFSIEKLNLLRACHLNGTSFARLSNASTCFRATYPITPSTSKFTSQDISCPMSTRRRSSLLPQTSAFQRIKRRTPDALRFYHPRGLHPFCFINIVFVRRGRCRSHP